VSATAELSHDSQRAWAGPPARPGERRDGAQYDRGRAAVAHKSPSRLKEIREIQFLQSLAPAGGAHTNRNERELIALGQAAAARREEQAASHSEEESEAIESAMRVESDVWFAISNWAKETKNLLPWQRSLAYSLGRLASRHAEPSPKQAARGLEILQEAETLGFRA